MQITINGDDMEAPEGTTVQGLLELLGTAQRRVAVERNGEIIPRSEHAGQRLAEGDRLEIVQAIGGG